MSCIVTFLIAIKLFVHHCSCRQEMCYKEPIKLVLLGIFVYKCSFLNIIPQIVLMAPRGDHYIVKLKTMCEQSLLPYFTCHR